MNHLSEWRARRDSNSRPSGSKRNSGLHAVQSHTTKPNKTKGNHAGTLLAFVRFCLAFSDKTRTVFPTLTLRKLLASLSSNFLCKILNSARSKAQEAIKPCLP